MLTLVRQTALESYFLYIVAALLTFYSYS